MSGKRKHMGPFLRLLHAKRRAKRITENERLRSALDEHCPVLSWRHCYESNRRACRQGERYLVDTLDSALRDRAPTAPNPEALFGEPESLFPC